MKKNYHLMKFSKYTVVLSLVVMLAAIVVFFTQGFVLGIDFSGGTLLTLDMGQAITNSDSPVIEEALVKQVKGDHLVTLSENNQVILRFQASADDEDAEANLRTAIIEEIKKTYPNVKMVAQERVGATAGHEMRMNALISVAIACVLMLAYIWYRFEFAFAVSAISAIVHDVLMMVAVMLFTRAQVNSSFIAALLTIVGYSVNDTIVLFDRIRENLKRYRDKSREEIVELSFAETLTRTINTSLTVFITITALYIVGVQSIKEFALPLIAGIVSGTYSTIFFASPLWLWIHEAMDKRNQKKKQGGGKKQLKPNKSKA